MLKDVQKIRLPERLDLAEIKTLACKILTQNPETQIIIDAKNVPYFGGLCAQTIVAGARRAKSAGALFAVENLNTRAREQLSLLGLSDQNFGADQIT
jgi:anti-anti-sigma regulatory factor